MTEKTHITPKGIIHYWTNDISGDRQALVFLPGLTADHMLFDKQVKAFEAHFDVIVWDAPGHAASRPFDLDFSLRDKASWLHDILQAEGVTRPVLVGQSMGGYVSQAFMQHYPGEAAGFVSIDSAPLKRKYYPAWELWLLRRMEPLYRMYPWKVLVSQGSKGTAESQYGRRLMAQMMTAYEDEPRYYARLVGHGYRILADSIAADLPYGIDCPCLLICGEKDKAGDTRSFNRRWAAGENLPIRWISGAGHNSNTDRPEEINTIIKSFLRSIAAKQ